MGALRQQVTLSSWTPPTPDRLFQRNKLVDADGSVLSRRNKLESFANFWQKQLRMYLGTHFPVYWTLLNYAEYRPSPKKPIFPPVQGRLNRGFTGLTVYTHAEHQQHTHVFALAHERQDPALTAWARSVQTPDQTERGGRP